ncbi:MAG: hypothetical protein KTR19_08420 [Hyphomicrobiales bacterium]|nr:hypothetical protein [Hyphomicrobiales bacterium]
MGWSSLIIGIGVVFIAAASAETTCYCRTATGEKLEVGKFACLKTNMGLREARCDLVLNNTAWIFTGKTCPVAGNTLTPQAMASAQQAK